MSHSQNTDLVESALESHDDMVETYAESGCEYNGFGQGYLPFGKESGILSSKSVVLSIRPRYVEPILRGTKVVELRRRFPQSISGSTAYIYSTSPIRELVGDVQISEVLKLPVETIWKKFSKCTHVNETEFNSYFSDLRKGNVLLLSEPREYRKKIPLHELRYKLGFEPPQSFLYARKDFCEFIKNEVE